MRHAKAALHLLRRELGEEATAGLLTGEAAHACLESSRAPERLAVLAIAYHNLAVQQERLDLSHEALRSFAHAADIARRWGGREGWGGRGRRWHTLTLGLAMIQAPGD